MKTLLAACVAFGAILAATPPPAHADVVVGVPGVHVDIGPHPHYRRRDAYWEHHRWEEHRRWCYYHGC